ncbi:MAG: MFS transporter [Fluviicola sp. XM-24bin1]|nr:MAG: MFS transporter [Fluviicola sp. XM-24bin1]
MDEVIDNSTKSNVANPEGGKKTNYGALITLTTVFFFWGFVAASNDILIPVFKEELNLQQWQSQMISFAFYVAYTVGSILYLIISLLLKRDILLKIGYKKGISLGLAISALGTLLFIPAASLESFGLMISGLFVVGLGFSLQQTAANPLVISLGDPEKGSQRLSLAGGVNNIGTTIGPVLIGLAIFGTTSGSSTNVGIESIMIPYLLLGLSFLIVAGLIMISKVPNHLESTVDSSEKSTKSLFDYPQLYLGMIAIFVYVGVEVATAGNLGEYLKVEFDMESSQITPYISLYWASLMIGRWTSAANVFSSKKMAQNILRFVLPYAAFGVFMLVNAINNQDLSQLYYYPLVIVVLILAEILSKGNPAKQLAIFSGLGILALLVGMFSDGLTSIYAFISVGLFCSTLWPCVFTLGINGLGGYTNKGSGFLVMMIMGGGFISLLQGVLVDQESIGIRLSFFVGVGCFVYLLFYALKMLGMNKVQEAE